ncbi:MAG TPA: hypothetical protein VFD32_17275 [Dehalococcoidia bacterium]|nr:hypothetical protein [Dehalococcoidia bacterium]
MAAMANAASDMLVGASVLTPAGQFLGRVDAVDGSRFHWRPPGAAAGAWLDVEEIGVFVGGCVVLASA